MPIFNKLFDFISDLGKIVLFVSLDFFGINNQTVLVWLSISCCRIKNFFVGWDCIFLVYYCNIKETRKIKIQEFLKKRTNELNLDEFFKFKFQTKNKSNIGVVIDGIQLTNTGLDRVSISK